MIYIDDQASDETDRPPMAGTRIRHEFVNDDVMRVWIEHAPQSFRGGRRAEVMVVPLREQPQPETDHFERCLDAAATAHVPPLVSPDYCHNGE